MDLYCQIQADFGEFSFCCHCQIKADFGEFGVTCKATHQIMIMMIFSKNSQGLKISMSSLLHCQFQADFGKSKHGQLHIK